MNPVLVHPMLAEATRDDGEAEQITGFHTMLEEKLAGPFKTEMLGVEVTVARVDITDDDHIVADCTRGKARQPIPILDLAMPDPRPARAEWIAAFRRWTRGR